MRGNEVPTNDDSHAFGRDPYLRGYLTRSYPSIMGDGLKNQPLSIPARMFHVDPDNSWRDGFVPLDGENNRLKVIDAPTYVVNEFV